MSLNRIIVAALLAVSLPVLAQKTGGLPEPDKEVLREMAQSNLAVLEAGRLAVEKSANARVKALAQSMVANQREMQNEVQGVAQARGEQLPFAPSVDQRGLLTELAGLSGPQFDRRFLSMSADAYEKALASAEQTAGEASDAEVKALAEQAVPHLRLYLADVTQLATGL